MAIGTESQANLWILALKISSLDYLKVKMNLRPNLFSVFVSIFLFFCIFALLFLVLTNKKGLTSDAIFLIVINSVCLVGLYRTLWFHFIDVIYEIPVKRFITYFLVPKFKLKNYESDEIDNLIDATHKLLKETTNEVKIYTKDKKLAFVIKRNQKGFELFRDLIKNSG